MLEYNNKSDSLQGLPNKKVNSHPYIAFSDRSGYRILVKYIKCQWSKAATKDSDEQKQ